MTDDIALIRSSEIIPDDTLTALASVSEDIEAGFTRRQRFRPRFLMETAVLNDMKFPTPDAKYWQCNVERDTHFRNLVMLSFDYKEKQADIGILEAECNALLCDLISADTDHQTELREAQIAKKRVQIDRETTILVYMKKEAGERAREIMNWTDIMAKLLPDMKHPVDDAEAYMPEAYAIRYGRETEAMKIAGALNAHDMSGAMNIISIAKTIEAHPQVKDLLKAAEQAKQIPGGDSGAD